MFFIILLQLFWLSFILIGSALLLISRQFLKGKFNGLHRFLVDSHLLVTIFILFCLGLAPLTLPIAIGYIFQLSLNIVIVPYLLLLLFSLIVAAVKRKTIYTFVSDRFRRLSKAQLIIGGIVVLGLAVEFGIAIVSKAPLDNDSPAHLAKIQQTLNLHRLSIKDAVMSYNGLIDLRYSANLLHSVQAVAANLLQIPAYKVWAYSAAFYQLLLSVGIFVSARVFLSKKSVPSPWLYFVLLLMPIFNVAYFFKYPELPHAIVVAWFALFLVSLKLLLEKKDYILFFIAVVFLAETHPINALAAAIFLSFLSTALFLTKSLSRKQLLAFTVAGLILLIPLIPNLYHPAPATHQDLKVQGLGDFHTRLKVSQHGPLVLPRIVLAKQDVAHNPDLIDITAIVVILVLFLFIVLLEKSKSKKLKQAMLVVVTIAALLAYNNLYFSLVGYGFLITQLKNRKLKILVLLAVIFNVLISYNPVVLTYVFGRIPLWILGRFQDLNVFAFWAPLIGLFFMYKFVAKYWGLASENIKGYSLMAMVLAIGYIAYYRVPVATKYITTANGQVRQMNQIDYPKMETLAALDPYIRDSVIFTTDTNVRDRMAIMTEGTVNFVYNYYASQMENLQQRNKCHNALLDNLKLNDLRAGKVTKVVLITGSDIDKSAKKSLEIAKQAPYLKFEAKVGRDLVYSVRSDPKVPIQPSICAIPYRQ